MNNYKVNMSSCYAYINSLFHGCEIISHKSKRPNIYLLDVIIGGETEATFICNSVTGDLEQLI